MQKRITAFSVFSMLLVALAFVMSSCNPNSTTPIIPLKSEELTADISDYGSFDAFNALVDSNSVYYLYSSVNNDSIVVSMTVTKIGLVPYTINVSTDDNSNITYAVEPNGTGKTYSASKLNGGSGQIRITSISPNLEGTFSGTLKQIGGSGTVTISNGAFNAAYK